MVLGLRHVINNSEDSFVLKSKCFTARGIQFIEQMVAGNTGQENDPIFGVVYLTVDKGLYDCAIEHKLPSGIVIGLGYRDKHDNLQRKAPVHGGSASNRGSEYFT